MDDNEAIHADFRKILGNHRDEAELDSIEDKLFGTSSDDALPTYELDSAFQGQEALQRVQALAARGQHYALAFVDMRMPPGWDGVTTIEHLWAVDPEIQIVICTAYSDYSWEELLKRFKHSDRLLILKKPFDTAEVCQLAFALTEKWSLARQAHLKLEQLKSMVDERTRELRTSETRYALAAAGSNDGLWDWDVETGNAYYSERWFSMLGDLDRQASTLEDWVARIHPDDIKQFQDDLHDHLEQRTNLLRSEHRIMHRDGQHRWVLARGLAVRGADGRPLRIAGSLTDITDRRLAEEQLKRAAFHDALTGLPNRALLSDRLRQCILLNRRRNERFAVLFLDLDRFKSINDSLGHLVGDRLLMAVGERLETCVRESDSVAVLDRSTVARLGGDEFVVLLRNLRSDSDAVRVAERIRLALTETIVVDGIELSTSVSIGIALSHSEYLDPSEILRDADIALYQAKEMRGTYRVFNPDMHAAAVLRWQMENDLAHAIERNEIFLVYQPIVALDSGAVHGVEALMRWNHPKLGLVPPSQFIPVAEESGLMLRLGSWALRTACVDLMRIRASVGSDHPLSVSVNVSTKQLSATGFAEEVETILRETGTPADSIRLEITESAFLSSDEVWNVTIPRLRDLGVRLHLDDFGTGYSSLSRLHSMPIEALKIDRSFISSLCKCTISASIVDAILALARTLGVVVVAEGVETREQAEAIKGLGCQFAQGYLFRRPIPFDDIWAMIATGR